MGKGEITTFTVVSVLILLTVVGAISLQKTVKTKQIEDIVVPAQVQPVRDIIQDCSTSLLKNSVHILGLQGGYIFLRDNMVNTQDVIVAYGYRDKEHTLPSLSIMEGEIERYIKMMVLNCINKDGFPQFEFMFGDIDAIVKIKEKSVSAEIFFPVIVIKGNTKYELTQVYNVHTPIRLREMYFFVDEVIKSNAKKEGFLDIAIVTQQEYEVDMIYLNEKIIMYSITDVRFPEEIDSYTFRFAYEIK